MPHKPRREMIAETRAKLIGAAREAFGSVGYAESSMDDFAAAAGLTRGAIYHHFGGKEGLLAAVIAEIDAEMSERLAEVSARASDPWAGFVDENIAYIEMALDPEIRRIVMQDGPAVLSGAATWPSQNACIAAMTRTLDRLKDAGEVGDIDAEATAWLLSGASLYAAQWIANSDDPDAISRRAVGAFRELLAGLRKRSIDQPA